MVLQNCNNNIWLIGFIYILIFLFVIYKGQIYLNNCCQKILFLFFYFFLFIIGSGIIYLICPCILFNSNICNNNLLYVAFYLLICYIIINNIKSDDEIT